MGREEVEAGLTLQQSLGGNVSWLTPEEAQEVYPLLNIDDGLFVGGTFGRRRHDVAPGGVGGVQKEGGGAGAELIPGGGNGRFLHHSHQVTGVQLQNGDVLQAGVVVNSAGRGAPKWPKPAAWSFPCSR